MPSGPKKRRASRKKNEANSSTSTIPAEEYHVGDVKTDAASEIGSMQSDCHVDNNVTEAVSELDLEDEIADLLKGSKEYISQIADGIAEIGSKEDDQYEDSSGMGLKKVSNQSVDLIAVEEPTTVKLMDNLDKSFVQSVEINMKESEYLDEQIIFEGNESSGFGENGLHDSPAIVNPDESLMSEGNGQIDVEEPTKVKLLVDIYKSVMDSVEINMKESEFVDDEIILEGTKCSDIGEKGLHDSALIVNPDVLSMYEGNVDTTSSKEPMTEQLKSFVNGVSSVLIPEVEEEVPSVHLNEAVGRVRTLVEKGLVILAEVSSQAENQSRFAKEWVMNLSQILDDLNSDKIVV